MAKSGGTVFETMELAEVSRRLAFIDEERRKDKELISTLLERIEAQTSAIDGLKKQVHDLEKRLATTNAQLVKFEQVDRSIEQLREELTLVIETNKEKHEKAQRELNRLRQIEQETVTRQISELRKELEPIPRYDEEIKSVRTETNRLGGLIAQLQHEVADLDKRSEDRVQSVIYLEEQRRQDTRRLNKLETDVPAIHKRIDDLGAKLPLLEQAIQQKNADLEEAGDMLDQQLEIIENQRADHFRYEKQFANWAETMEEIKEETQEMALQTVSLRDQHDRTRRSLADLEKFRERIERRQDEVTEMQRVAEERQKRTLEDWLTEREKDWERFVRRSDERWQENSRIQVKRDARVSLVEEQFPPLYQQIELLWDVHEAWAHAFSLVPREWTDTWNEMTKRRPAMPEPIKPKKRIETAKRPIAKLERLEE